MYWANFLHFYQPPTQKSYWVNKITAESYRPILKGLLEQKTNKVTININGILLELFEEHGHADVIDLVRELLKTGQIELTGSAKYHPLLPFLPEAEIVRQIKLNEETLKKYFGDLWKPTGFFPPEMGFDINVARIVKKLGYQWIIVDELSFPLDQRPVDYGAIYSIPDIEDFNIYFRERRMSWIILSGQVGTANLLVKNLGDRLEKSEYLLTAMDGESFGHHRPGLEQLLFEMHEESGLKSVLVSDLPKYFTNKKQIKPIPSTWALMEKELEKREPFARWLDEGNEIQEKQWELTNHAIYVVERANPKRNGYAEARHALDRALHSDQYWWASARPWWSIEMIERGAKELLDAVIRTPRVRSRDMKKAEQLYQEIIYTAFDWQRSGKVDELSKKEDEDIRQRTDVNIPKLPKEEIEKMIGKLEEEMKSVVASQEFERAAQIRNRIAELRRYMKDELRIV